MNTSSLVPLLCHLNERASTSPGLEDLGHELGVALRAIERLNAVAPDAPELSDASHVRNRGFTGSGSRACPCCGRPF